MNIHTFRLQSIPALLSLLLVAASATAGPLNPPAGPVTSTHKTLTEVEPRTAINATNTPGDANSLFKITQPGSSYLTGNITGVAGKHGIAIASSGVTLDLNGFDLAGVEGSLDGVSVTAVLLRNIAVVNGSVRNWGDEGVDLGTSTSTNGRIEGVRTSGNVGEGISIGRGSTVSNCAAHQNGLDGIVTREGSTVSNCSAYQNNGNGITGTDGCTISNCSTFDNSGNGISVIGGSTVQGCTVRASFLDGILCNVSCVIRDNTCSSNGIGTGNGAGIHATGADNRIEGNNCTAADRGIDVDVAGNIIIRNTCSGNSNNWDAVAGNVILVINAATSGAVTGNSDGTAPGSTDPNANFTY